MRHFTVYDQATGIILRSGSVANADDLLLQPEAGEGMLQDIRLSSDTHKVVDGQAVALTPPVETLADVKADAKSAVAQRRWEVEIGGMTFNGMQVDTDDRAKLLINSAAERARADSAFTTSWKTSNGAWAVLDASTVLALYDALFAYVSSCFSREQALDVLIDAATDAAAVAALDSAILQFWP